MLSVAMLLHTRMAAFTPFSFIHLFASAMAGDFCQPSEMAAPKSL